MKMAIDKHGKHEPPDSLSHKFEKKKKETNQQTNELRNIPQSIVQTTNSQLPLIGGINNEITNFPPIYFCLFPCAMI